MTSGLDVAAGTRFGFGKNWARFLAVLDEERIIAAESSLKQMLGVADLRGLTFLDIGCGSGLSSLAARRLGAIVRSFDFDRQSVACADELKRRYFDGDADWQIEEGSVLDREYMRRLGQFDVVYSWGVLHHTGAMWIALENAIGRVARANGHLYIAIYNDQGWKSRVWWFIKLTFNRMPQVLRPAYVAIVATLTRIAVFLKHAFRLRPLTGLRSMFESRRERGMSAKHDRVDWVGGFPYEFATFETLVEYLAARGYRVTASKRATSLGCHELVARRAPCAD